MGKLYGNRGLRKDKLIGTKDIGQRNLKGTGDRGKRHLTEKRHVMVLGM